MFSNNGPVQKANIKVAMVWYDGTDAISKGVGLVYDVAEGTATEHDNKPGNYVIKPAASFDARDFAGVALATYTAQAGGQFIEIAVPGSKGVEVLLDTGISAVLNTGYLTLVGTSGEWTNGGGNTNGSAIPRQTAGPAVVCQADLCIGGVGGGTVTLTPDATDNAGVNVIPPNATGVVLGANVSGVTDYTVLPAVADVPIGHQICIVGGAANSELRTPASSGSTINGVDSDGTQEYLITATQIVIVTKTLSTGWIAQQITALGADTTAVVPD